MKMEEFEILYVNVMESESTYIDEVGLENLITFHEADFGITGGYYFNQGRNDRINNVIQNLYDLRLKLKNGKNPAQVVIKLLMNSMCGKTMIKPVETDTVSKESRGGFDI